MTRKIKKTGSMRARFPSNGNVKRAFCLIALGLSATLCPPAEGAPKAIPVPKTVAAGSTNRLGSPGWLLNSSPPLLRTNAPRDKRSAPDLPKPGVYKASPYTMIVIVPGRHPDEGKAPGFFPQNPVSKMPTIKPDLKLIPLERAPQGAFITRSLTNYPPP